MTKREGWRAADRNSDPAERAIQKQRQDEDRVLERAAELDPADASLKARVIRETAASIRDHREADSGRWFFFEVEVERDGEVFTDVAADAYHYAYAQQTARRIAREWLASGVTWVKVIVCEYRLDRGQWIRVGPSTMAPVIARNRT